MPRTESCGGGKATGRRLPWRAGRRRWPPRTRCPTDGAVRSDGQAPSWARTCSNLWWPESTYKVPGNVGDRRCPTLVALTAMRLADTWSHGAARQDFRLRRRQIRKYLAAFVEPGQEVLDALFEGVLGAPSKQVGGPRAAAVGAGRVARPPGGRRNGDRSVDDLVERVDELQDGGPRSGAQIHHHVLRLVCLEQRVEDFQRSHVGGGEVANVQVVPDPGTVPGGVVQTGHPEGVARPVSLHQLAERVGRCGYLQSRAHLGVGADRVEVPQRQYP